MRRLRAGHARALATVSVGVGLAVAVAGCSADSAPGAAAIDADGDVVVSVSEVEDVAAELTEAFPGTQGLARLVLFLSVVRDDVRDLARDTGDLLSTEEAKRGFAEQGVELSDPASEILAVSVMLSALDQGPAAPDLAERINALEPTVNPRYGTWDGDIWQPGAAALPIVDAPLPWIEVSDGAPAGAVEAPAEDPAAPAEDPADGGADG